MKKRIGALLIAVLLLSGCTKVGESGAQSGEEQAGVSFDTVERQTYPVGYSDQVLHLEAEDAKMSGSIRLGTQRAGYSGEGYARGFMAPSSNNWHLTAEIPVSALYKLTLSVASDEPAYARLTVNGEFAGELRAAGTGEFEQLELDCVYLEKGEAVLSVSGVQGEGEFDIDYVELSGAIAPADTQFAVEPTLIDPEPIPAAQGLMKLLCEAYGEYSFSAQQVTAGGNMELDVIRALTGKSPAIRGGDLGAYSLAMGGEGNGETELAAKWAQKGGIVAFTWYWRAPAGEAEFLQSETTFRLSDAVTDEAIALLGEEELEQLALTGKISEECLALVRDIDRIAYELGLLQSEDIPVLWRPLPGAGGDWYWWGASGDLAYQWLWKLMVARMQGYHGLHNLIWVWDGQSTQRYPGDAYVDIVSQDVYMEDAAHSSQIGNFLEAAGITTAKKLIALSECATLPDPDKMYRDRAMWAWMSVWGGAYMLTPGAEYNPAYNDTDWLIEYYNHDHVVTLNQLPYLATYTNESSIF